MTARRLLAVVLLLRHWMGAYSFVGVTTRQASASPHAPLVGPVFLFPENENNKNMGGIIVGEAVSGTSSSSLVISPRLSPLEAWCVTHMDVWYNRSLSIKCPFLKRRTADLLDGLDMMMRFLVIRHKSLDLIGPPPGCRSIRMSQVKYRHTTVEERMDIIRQDWRPETNKGYYITGRLNTTIYRDDCFFDGPDPDMPVKGLRKYINAASHLFDHATSTAELLSLEADTTAIVARWRLQGVLHLPWHPKLPVWTGRTTYHFDEEGLVCHHEEEWDISVAQAFLETLLPNVASRIWTQQPEEESGSA